MCASCRDLLVSGRTLRTDTLQQAISDYWEEYGPDLKVRTKESYNTHLKHILEYFKPKTRLHTIDYLKAKAFRDGLCSGEFSTSGKPLSASRINNYLMLLKSVYDLAMRKDLSLTRNPAEGLLGTYPCHGAAIVCPILQEVVLLW